MFKLAKDLIIIDVETTGIDPQTSSIIQIGAVIFNKNGYILENDTFKMYVKPYTNEWTEGAYKVHKINYSDLIEKGRDIENALLAFESWAFKYCRQSLQWDYDLAQWSCGFDVAMLKEAYKRAGRKFPFYYRAYDIGSIVRFELAKQGKLDMKAGEDICANILGIEIDGNRLHDAEYDALLSGKMLQKLTKGVNNET